ncbi:Oxidoreductase molybdopterin-binding protein [Glarea lozoyensis ATCC 20868]|uniref:Nitrate reductase [NADPH] n=1 Tax=Glarea lozoyensis (strain ATCC 20868 / MF5171) TaxID=1116229 RepID=S3D849_GLAL2|nr:Oxidoreductase molybdopterin-binding protein [Glarea lozoyensis ATCC 20868]EPE34677.1 Oxidoreductase molybdopterin-binding protein [Glarea lozoyensis ATCC 20868]
MSLPNTTRRAFLRLCRVKNSPPAPLRTSVQCRRYMNSSRPSPTPISRICQARGALPLFLFLGSLGWGLVTNLEAEEAVSPNQNASSNVNEKNEKSFRLPEIKEHGPKSERPWVIRGDRVYDITDWIAGHPGGEVILRAAGGSVEPYWKIFNIHQKQEVYDILEMYFIGTVDPQDLVNGSVPSDAIEDPFINDPVRDPRLHQHTSRPCNAETPASHLSTFITPNHVFYVRNHMWVPSPPPNTTLTIELPSGDEISIPLDDLKTKFPQHTITSTLQCSGNRRSHMTKACTHTSGLQWKAGAIGTATWTGPFLRDVLASTGFPIANPPQDAKHVQFVGHEAYGASIPIDKALSFSGDVILAHTMNSAPIPPDHGYPLRVVVPGHVAARSVKWLSKIAISDEESTSQWQRRDYKSFGPNERGLEDWSKAKSIQEMPVNSAVTSVVPLPGGGFVVKGWAYSGGGREIVRVDVSTNGGRSWDQAVLKEEQELGSSSKHWAWKQWRYTIPSYTISDAKSKSENLEGKKKAKMTLVVKATDEAYNTQPEKFEPIYNVRGNLAVAWHRVPLSVEKLERRERKGEN